MKQNFSTPIIKPISPINHQDNQKERQSTGSNLKEEDRQEKERKRLGSSMTRSHLTPSQSQQMAPILAILSATPSKDTTKTPGMDNLPHLSLHQLHRIPAPEHIVLPIEVVLSAHLAIRDTDTHRPLEHLLSGLSTWRNVIAATEQRLAVCGTVIWAGAAVAGGAAACAVGAHRHGAEATGAII